MADTPHEPAYVPVPHWLPKDAPEGAILLQMTDGGVVYVRDEATGRVCSYHQDGGSLRMDLTPSAADLRIGRFLLAVAAAVIGAVVIILIRLWL